MRLTNDPMQAWQAEIGDVKVTGSGAHFPNHRSVFITQPSHEGEDDIVMFKLEEVPVLISELQELLRLYEETPVK